MHQEVMLVSRRYNDNMSEILCSLHNILNIILSAVHKTHKQEKESITTYIGYKGGLNLVKQV